ncbi:TetR/AcrR family transcriptional regulator [Pokkaliibacter sp. CJK22405]|uniref:TetR/AcrR family transcriptional regulator n=1 Tax=Pokkaliibacter sp. CJK22405 TaxID=3384615 RepID=UPI0039855EE0
MRADAQQNYQQLLTIAQQEFAEQGVNASLRNIARKAEVGMGTLYRHFPNREALLEAILRSSFDAAAVRARHVAEQHHSEEALMLWVSEITEFTYTHQGIIQLMMGAIEDLDSALHSSCVSLRAAGAELLRNAQEEGKARADLSGDELFDLIAALAWLKEQPSSGVRAERHFEILSRAILTAPR